MSAQVGAGMGGITLVGCRQGGWGTGGSLKGSGTTSSLRLTPCGLVVCTNKYLKFVDKKQARRLSDLLDEASARRHRGEAKKARGGAAEAVAATAKSGTMDTATLAD